MSADDWLDKASGKWLTGPEVEANRGLSGRILRLGEENMADGNVRPVLYVDIEGRERVVAVNATNAETLRRYLKGRASASLIGKRVSFKTEVARNPRTGVTGPAVRIAEVKG